MLLKFKFSIILCWQDKRSCGHLGPRFCASGGEPEQRIAPVQESGFLLLEHDLSGHAEPGARAELGRAAAEEADAPFPLVLDELSEGELDRSWARNP